jgi:hypothetical protein
MSILRMKNKPAKINFDFGEIEKTITLGQSANLWLNTIYNSEYTISFSAIPNVKVSKNQIVLTPISTGEYKITIKVQSKGRATEIKSNEVKLTVE